MPTARINGRLVELPSSATAEIIRREAGIDAERSVIRRTREGNFLVPTGQVIDVEEGDAFLDAPARVKGSEGIEEAALGRLLGWLFGVHTDSFTQRQPLTRTITSANYDNVRLPLGRL